MRYPMQALKLISLFGHFHDDVIKLNHFPRYWPFVREIHRPPVNPPQKGQCRGALTFFLICVWINAWINNREAGDLRRHCAHYDVIAMLNMIWCFPSTTVICMIKDVRPQQLIMFPLLERIAGRRKLYHLTRIRVSAREAHSVNNVIVIFYYQRNNFTDHSWLLVPCYMSDISLT